MYMSSFFFQFMGGNTDLIDHRTKYYETAEFLFNLTLAANLHGDYMPLWGTCLGFELLGKEDKSATNYHTSWREKAVGVRRLILPWL